MAQLNGGELHDLANMVWGTLGSEDAGLLNRLALQIGPTEMGLRLRALAYQVIKGSIDPPSAAVWLARQRPRHGQDP